MATNPELVADTVWLTRDLDEATGIFREVVDVWVSRPRRHRITEYGEGAFWLDEFDSLEDLLDELTLTECRARYGTIPETSRECVKAG